MIWVSLVETRDLKPAEHDVRDTLVPRGPPSSLCPRLPGGQPRALPAAEPRRYRQREASPRPCRVRGEPGDGGCGSRREANSSAEGEPERGWSPRGVLGWGKARAGTSHPVCALLVLGSEITWQLWILWGKTKAPEGFGCRQPLSRYSVP